MMTDICTEARGAHRAVVDGVGRRRRISGGRLEW
jgi:hypothetical protein